MWIWWFSQLVMFNSLPNVPHYTQMELTQHHMMPIVTMYMHFFPLGIFSHVMQKTISLSVINALTLEPIQCMCIFIPNKHIQCINRKVLFDWLVQSNTFLYYCFIVHCFTHMCSWYRILQQGQMDSLTLSTWLQNYLYTILSTLQWHHCNCPSEQ